MYRHLMALVGIAAGGAAAAQEPTDFVALAKRGFAAFEAEQWDRAASLLDSAHALRPQHPQVAHALAASLVKIGIRQRNAERRHDAVTSLERAATLWPGQVEILLSLGTVHAELDDTRLAEEWFEAALEVAPDDGRVLASLAQLAEDRDDLVRAAELWQRASAAAPERPVYRERAEIATRHAEVERGFRTLPHGVFCIRYPPGREAGVESGVPAVRAWLSEALRDLRRDLGHMPAEPITIVLYGEGQYRAVSTAQHWAVAYFDGKVRLDFGGWEERREVLRGSLRHELAHAFLHRFHPGLPTWVHEGYAQLIEGRSLAAARSILRGRRAEELETVFDGSFAETDDWVVAKRGYALSLLLVDDLRGRRTPREFARLLAVLARGEGAHEAVRAVYGIELDDVGAAAAPVR